MPTFATFSPWLPNKAPATVLPVAMALLGSPGENVVKVGTILPLPYHPLSLKSVSLHRIVDQRMCSGWSEISDGEVYSGVELTS